MDKPIEILKIEKYIGFKLIENDDLSKIKYNHYSYQLNNKGEVVGLNLIDANLFGSKGECLQDLEHLQILYISENEELTDFRFLKSLINLKELYLSGTWFNLIDLPTLKNLEILEAQRTSIITLKNLDNLHNLNYLDLSFNKIKKFENLNTLFNLKVLDLSNNDIEEIVSPIFLPNLESLNISGNKVSEIKNLNQLNNLTDLYLNDNKINCIESLNSLSKLEVLSLGNNKIFDIKSLTKNTKLSKIYLYNNDISDISSLLKIDSLLEVNLKGNPKIEIDYPKEVLNAGWEAIREFSEKSKEKIVFRNVKVLLLGNPNIGKSNLLEYLETNQKPILKNSTHGVQYKKINLNNTNFHVWDFGGQEYFHATHQLFFSNNAINIILWGKDIARENSNERCFGIDYWLRVIQQLNGNSNEIVFLTENKIDFNTPKFSEKNISKELENKFQNLRFYENHISLTELRNLNGYKEKLINISEEIISRFTYPQFYEVFWKRIESIEKDYVAIEEINNRPHKENVISAMKVFHNMGMLLYFHDFLPNKVFVKPQTLLELLYQKVLNDNKRYRITQNEIAESIKNNTLDLTDNELIDLLKHFNLVFEIDEEKNNYFIPQYLPEQNETQKYFEKLGFNICNIKIKADHYLVSLAMLKLFSTYGKFVDKKKGEYQFWKDGIAISKDNESALIKYDSENQLINLYSSKNSDNKKLQKEIVDFVLDLPESIYLPKRNFDNHIKKRWIDVLDEDDEDFSPHFGERLEQYPEYYDEFINRNYKNEYSWNSDYFTVSVSFDGEFFAEWNQLINNDNLKEMNFYNDEKESKKVNIKEYYFYINKNLEDVMEKEEKGNTIFNVNVHDGGTLGAVDNSGTININQNEKTKDEKPTNSEKDKIIDKKIRVWKNWGIFLFVFYIIIYISAFIIQKNEYNIFGFTKQGWLEFKKSTVFEILKYFVLLAGVYLFYKLFYDRVIDPSKEKAKRDLLK